MDLHSYLSAMLYYRAVITSGVDHGYILYILHIIHVVTKVGSARRVPTSDSDVGAEGAGGSTQVVVGLGSRRPPTVILWRSDRAG